MAAYIAEKLGGEGWLCLYSHSESPNEEISYFCALARREDVESCLDNTSWDLSIGDGLPGFTFSFDDDSYRYDRFGDESGIEPLVILRDFCRLKPAYWELSEEFRHFHNLYEDRQSGTFVAIDGNGDDVEVVRMAPDKIEVRARYLRDYLAARGMVLLLFFEYHRWSPKTLAGLGLAEEQEEQRAPNYFYLRLIAPWPDYDDSGRKTFARLLGKKVVEGTTGYQPCWPGDRDGKEYESFVIDTDDDGTEIRHASDEAQLANYFGKNPDAPHYLTPVFFRKEVLGKYYGDPGKYRVEDGNLYCGSYWSLKLDNNHPDYVVVFLGDLGNLSSTEQRYWRSFNVPPDGAMSEVAIRRSILGQWADADEPALAFKAAYSRFRQDWRATSGWELFKPLGPDDEHHLHGLHVPTGQNQKEFDEQVMALSKLLVERLNEAELGRRITLDEGDKGITKLEKYLDGVSFPKDRLVTFLRNLNGLRSGPAHVKGRDYKRAAEHFDVAGKGHARAFAGMLTEATALIGQLDALRGQLSVAESERTASGN